MTTTPTPQLTPQALEEEDALLGAMILSSAAIDAALELKLTAADFHRPASGELFEAITTLHTTGQPVDARTIIAETRRRGCLQMLGGPAAIIGLTEHTPSAANARAYAREVLDAARLRQLVQAGEAISRLGYEAANGRLPDGAESVQQVLEQALGIASSIGADADRLGSGFTPIEDAFARVYDDLADRALTGRAAGDPTGYQALDRMIGGLQPEQLIIVAARPGMGKSAFALNIAANVAQRTGKAAALFSMEMSTDELATRMLTTASGVSGTRIQQGTVDTADWQAMMDAITRMHREIPGRVMVDQSTTSTPAQLATRCRRLIAQLRRRGVELGVIVVDYLQLMTADRRTDNRSVEIGQISSALKRLASELKVPVVALSQLNRQVEQRTDKRPQLSDLREGGSIEQDANKVLFLYRPEYYATDDAPCADHLRGKCEVIIAKNRTGATGSVWLGFQPHTARFTNPVEAA